MLCKLIMTGHGLPEARQVDSANGVYFLGRKPEPAAASIEILAGDRLLQLTGGIRAARDAALTRRTERAQTGGMQVRSYKYRLRPSRSQAALLDAMLRDFCGLYNAGLQQRRACSNGLRRTAAAS
ncbi:hypothetical protein ACU4GR_23705 [Methylobacterium oryzae CBMB20]